jgi:hypothetical protein
MSSASRSDRDLVSFAVFCQNRTPDGALGSRALPFPSDLFLYPCDLSRRSFGVGGSVGILLLRCKGGDDFFKARVAAQRIPKRQQFQFAIAW